jgi:hypothetical protein
VSWANRLDIAGIGANGAMYKKTWDEGGWLPS